MGGRRLPEKECARQGSEQQAWAPRDGQQSWLQLMHEITVLRLPPQFSRSSRHFTELSSGPAWGPHSPRHIVEIARVWYGDDSDEEEDWVAAHLPSSTRRVVVDRTLLTGIGSTATAVVTRGRAARTTQRMAEKMQGNTQHD